MFLLFTKIIIKTDFPETKNLEKINFTYFVSKNSRLNTYVLSSSAFIIGTYVVILLQVSFEEPRAGGI